MNQLCMSGQDKAQVVTCHSGQVLPVCLQGGPADSFRMYKWPVAAFSARIMELKEETNETLTSFYRSKESRWGTT